MANKQKNLPKNLQQPFSMYSSREKNRPRESISLAKWPHSVWWCLLDRRAKNEATPPRARRFSWIPSFLRESGSSGRVRGKKEQEKRRRGKKDAAAAFSPCGAIIAARSRKEKEKAGRKEDAKGNGAWRVENLPRLYAKAPVMKVPSENSPSVLRRGTFDYFGWQRLRNSEIGGLSRYKSQIIHNLYWETQFLKLVHKVTDFYTVKDMDENNWKYSSFVLNDSHNVANTGLSLYKTVAKFTIS